jgi:hypothetical protein
MCCEGRRELRIGVFIPETSAKRETSVEARNPRPYRPRRATYPGGLRNSQKLWPEAEALAVDLVERPAFPRQYLDPLYDQAWDTGVGGQKQPYAS